MRTDITIICSMYADERVLLYNIGRCMKINKQKDSTISACIFVLVLKIIIWDMPDCNGCNLVYFV